MRVENCYEPCFASLIEFLSALNKFIFWALLNPEFPLGNLMEKKQFLWDFCPAWGANSELLATKRGEKHQKVFFYTNLVPKARLMEILGWMRQEK